MRKVSTEEGEGRPDGQQSTEWRVSGRQAGVDKPQGGLTEEGRPGGTFLFFGWASEREERCNIPP